MLFIKNFQRSPDVSEGSGDEVNEPSNFSSFFMDAKVSLFLILNLYKLFRTTNWKW